MTKIVKRETEIGTLFQAHDEHDNTVGLGAASVTPDGKLSVDSIYVNPKSRGKGFGATLLQAILGWGRDQGASEVTGEFKPLDDEAEEFYRKQGISVTHDGKLSGKT